jgi:hypothetical protein
MISVIPRNPRLYAHASAMFGALAWLGLLGVALPEGSVTAPIIRLLAFAVLVCIPLGLPLTILHDTQDLPSRLYHLTVVLQLPAALCATVACWLRPGAAAACLALPWTLWTVLAAAWGLRRVTMHARTAVEEWSIDVGLLFLPIGGAWLALVCAGLDPGGFGRTIDVLVALHYHYAGFAAPLLTGLVGRQLAPLWASPQAGQILRWGYGALACGVCVGPLLIAASTILSPALAVLAVAVLALSLVGLALLVLLLVLPAQQPKDSMRCSISSPLARILLSISSGAVLFSMLLGMIYAVSDSTRHPLLSIPQMVALHGVANAFGFVLCGLLGWTVSEDAARA